MRKGNFLELPSYWIGQRAKELKEIETADTSHLDNERISERLDCILAETEKAYKLRLGYWRGGQREVWAPKSQVQLVTESGMQWALIPVWLAKKWGYLISITSKTVKAQSANCQGCDVEMTTYTTAPPPKCAACRQPNY